MDRLKMDYSFHVGDFNSQNMVVGEKHKLIALMNLLTTTPGSIENNPDFGISMRDYLYETGEEDITKAKKNFEAKLKTQASRYIGEDVILGVTFEESESTGSGSKAMYVGIETSFGNLQLMSIAENGTIKLKQAMINDSLFRE